GQRVVLDLRDVGQARTGRDRVLQRRVRVDARADVDELDVDLGVVGLELLDDGLKSGLPGPHEEVAALLERGVGITRSRRSAAGERDRADADEGCCAEDARARPGHPEHGATPLSWW